MENTDSKFTHTLWTLPYSPRGEYAVFIDETNLNPNSDKPNQNCTETRFVAVIAPLSEYPNSRGTHAAEAPKDKDKETLVSDFKTFSQSSVATIGLTFDYCKSGSSWLSRVYDVTELISRILEKSNRFVKKLAFYPEESKEVEAMRKSEFPGCNASSPLKGEVAPKSPGETQIALNRQSKVYYRTWKSLLEELFSSSVKVSIEIISKSKNWDKIVCSLKGEEEFKKAYWADLLAYAWRGDALKGSPDAEPVSEIVASSKWKTISQYCMFNKEQTAEIFNAFENEQGFISESDWFKFSLKDRESYPRFLLDAIGKHARENTHEWERYMGYTQTHLNSKSTRMEALKVQLEWLNKNKPKVISEQDLLTLLMLEIATGNHEGYATEPKTKLKIKELLKNLEEEDVRRIADAHLYLAVSETNRFNFQGAKNKLLELCDILEIDLKDTSSSKRLNLSLGATLTGRFLSSLGQCEAFLGNNKGAIDLFEKALACFRKVSDDTEARRDIDQTLSYKLIAKMDICSGKEEEAILKKEMEEYLGGKFPEICQTIATQRDPEKQNKEKYHHHILLRYLAKEFAPPGARDAYCKERWNSGDNTHPWELIEFYRGTLFESKVAKGKSIKICKGKGTTLKIFRLIFLGAFYPEKLSAELTPDNLKDLNLYLRDKARVLIEQPYTKRKPLELIKEILPFNFR